MFEKIKTNVDRLLLVSIMKKKCSIYFAKTELFFIFKTKSSLSTSVFIFIFWTQTCIEKTVSLNQRNISMIYGQRKKFLGV